MDSEASRRIAVLSLLAIALLPLSACSPAGKEIPPEAMERAQAAIQPFKERLQGALVSALAEGPENAVKVCRLEAGRIAADLSVDGIRMGRTSHRVRNSDNAPEPWMEPLLAAYQADPGLEEPRGVWLDERTVGFVEPIRLKAFCLSCHGPSVETALLEEIRALYPEDQATGFRVGDLRGLFWVTLPAS